MKEPTKSFSIKERISKEDFDYWHTRQCKNEIENGEYCMGYQYVEPRELMDSKVSEEKHPIKNGLAIAGCVASFVYSLSINCVEKGYFVFMCFFMAVGIVLVRAGFNEEIARYKLVNFSCLFSGAYLVAAGIIISRILVASGGVIEQNSKEAIGIFSLLPGILVACLLGNATDKLAKNMFWKRFNGQVVSLPLVGYYTTFDFRTDSSENSDGKRDNNNSYFKRVEAVYRNVLVGGGYYDLTIPIVWYDGEVAPEVLSFEVDEESGIYRKL